MSKLLLLLALLLLGSCSSLHVHRFWEAPHATIRHYHHYQRKNERQRRRMVKPNITWSKL